MTVSEGTPSIAGLPVNGRYRRIRQLGAGGMGVVYEVIDRLNGNTVALKRVAPGAMPVEPAPSNATTAKAFHTIDRDDVLSLHLAREFQLLASLRHPNIISVLDYGIESSQETGDPYLYYTMEILPGARTILEFAQEAGINERIRLFVELLEALEYLHRRGILHCDLKPENVLVSAAGQVKVVDFGLSTLREQVEAPHDGVPAGTLTYMAPELLRGGVATEASDLFAAGVIAYQLLTGRYPFDKSTLAGLIRSIQTADPDLMPLYELNPSTDDTVAMTANLVMSQIPTLPGVIRRLLAKTPTERYASARAVIADLVAAGLPIQPESRDVRDSFLQAADFVGRNSELEQLRYALAAARQGNGSAFLVGGESGAGKSRLLNELRTYALISGAQVLTGQAVEGGGLVYEAWRAPLRRLALTTPLTDLQAGILKDLIPDIDLLLERAIPNVPSLEGSAESQRLLRTITEVFRSQQKPTVVFLEDLHWARESLDILRALLPLTRFQPLLVIGSYRVEEKGNLPAELPGMIPIRLAQMTTEDISALSKSMLGDAATPQLSALLESETEGNALFIVEVVRSLAEEAGALDRVSVQSSPFRVTAGGILAILRRRLHRVAPASRPLLDAAAVAGRVLDLSVLTVFIRDNPGFAPVYDLDRWLRDCADAAVLEVADGQWRFAHDKLREVLNIDLIEDGSLSDISRRVALAIEAAYPDPAGRALRAAALADHWRNAGDTAREADALEIAGRVALESALYEQAEGYHARALPLVKGDALRTARLMVQLTESQYSLGGLGQPRDTALRALKLMGYSITTDAGQQSRVMSMMMLQLLWRIIRPPRECTPEQDAVSMMALKALERLSLIYFWQNERVPTAYFSLYSALVAEEVSSYRRLERAHGYATGATALGSSRRWLANLLSRRADNAIRSVADINTIIWLYLGTGILKIINADWDDAESRLRRSYDLARQVSSIRRFEESGMALAGNYYYSGRWEDGKTITSELYEVANQYDTPIAVGWALDNMGRYAMREGRLEEAREIFQRGLAIYEQVGDKNDAVWCRGAIAKSYLCEGDLESARPYVEVVTVALRVTPTTSSGMTEAFSAAAEYYLSQWEQLIASAAADSSAVFQSAADARTATAALGRYADIFVLARPRYRAFLGWQRRLEGNIGAAIRIGIRAVSKSARLKMPYDEGISCVELARHYARGDSRREANLRRAEVIFMRLGAGYDLERTRMLLNG